MKKRYIAAAAIPGIVIVFLGGGFGMEAHNGLTSISLPPLALLAWPFIAVAANSIELGDIEPTDAAASWLLKSVSFIYDFMFLFMLLFIPATFFALVGILGELPPPWFVDNAASPSSPFYSLLNNMFFSFLVRPWACSPPKSKNSGHGVVQHRDTGGEFAVFNKTVTIGCFFVLRRVYTNF